MNKTTSQADTGQSVFVDPVAYLARFGITATLVASDNALPQAA